MAAFDRRNMLGAMGVGSALALLPACVSGRQQKVAATPFFERIGKPIGLQLYALGDEVANDIPGTMRLVAELGYGEVELPGLYGQQPADLRAAADAAGIAITSLHVPARRFLPRDEITFEDDPQRIADIAGALGVARLVIPFPILPDDFAPGEGEEFPDAITRAFSSLGIDEWRTMAERFDAIGAAMRAHGLSVGYHNHNLEFAPLGDTTPWQILMQGTDPALLKVQLDVGWVAQAGRDPVAELRALGSRVTSLHVKDIAEGSGPSYYFGMRPTEVGSGTIDWAQVLPAAEAVGVLSYYVEQEPPYSMPRPKAMATAYNYLSQLLA